MILMASRAPWVQAKWRAVDLSHWKTIKPHIHRHKDGSQLLAWHRQGKVLQKGDILSAAGPSLMREHPELLWQWTERPSSVIDVSGCNLYQFNYPKLLLNALTLLLQTEDDKWRSVSVFVSVRSRSRVRKSGCFCIHCKPHSSMAALLFKCKKKKSNLFQNGDIIAWHYAYLTILLFLSPNFLQGMVWFIVSKSFYRNNSWW